MSKRTAKRFFSYIFLFIFFSKMVICVMPFIASSFDNKAINAVIMQLEIEHGNEKDAKESVKESPVKGEWLSSFQQFSFSNPGSILSSRYFLFDDEAVQPFYPTVPTPPPSV